MKKAVSILLALVVLTASFLAFSGINTPLYKDYIVATKMFADDEKVAKTAYAVKGLDETEEFVVVEFVDSGYAVYLKEDMTLLEYAPFAQSPFNQSNSYYAGPTQYFEKEGNVFINKFTDEEVSITEAQTVAQSIRNNFIVENDMVEEKETHKEFRINDGSAPNGEILNNNYEGVYIDNAWYFVRNPSHGYAGLMNRPLIDDDVIDYNPEGIGVCTTVATQLLLTYNNYFTDRRIIPRQDSNSNDNEWLYYDYGDISQRRNNFFSLGSRYRFFNKLLEYFNGQTFYDASDAIYIYLENFAPEIKDTITVSCAMSSNGISNNVINEIDNNRPLLIGMTAFAENVDSWHVVVCYGYRNYDKQFGYIVHYGHGFSGTEHVWTNENWYFQYLTMSSTHQHSYNYIGGEYHEQICTVCGQNEPTDMHSFTYEFVEYNNMKHIAYCRCGEPQIMVHTFEARGIGHPTYHERVCTGCGYIIIEDHIEKQNLGRCIWCLESFSATQATEGDLISTDEIDEEGKEIINSEEDDTKEIIQNGVE